MIFLILKDIDRMFARNRTLHKSVNTAGNVILLKQLKEKNNGNMCRNQHVSCRFLIDILMTRFRFFCFWKMMVSYLNILFLFQHETFDIVYVCILYGWLLHRSTGGEFRGETIIMVGTRFRMTWPPNYYLAPVDDPYHLVIVVVVVDVVLTELLASTQHKLCAVHWMHVALVVYLNFVILEYCIIIVCHSFFHCFFNVPRKTIFWLFDVSFMYVMVSYNA